MRVSSHAFAKVTEIRQRIRETVGLAWTKRAKLIGLRFHDLRHMHATMLLDAGLPTSAVAARLGHAKESTTTDIYSHAIRRRDREAADTVGRLLG